MQQCNSYILTLCMMSTGFQKVGESEVCERDLLDEYVYLCSRGQARSWLLQ